MNLTSGALQIVFLASCASCAFGAPANPAERLNGVSGYVRFMSNYVGRGLAQSLGQPSVQGEINYYAAAGWYLTLDATSINWVDQLYPGDSVSVELDGIVGYRHALTQNLEYKVGVLQLQYPGRYVPQSPPVARPDTTEVFGYLGWNRLSAQLNYSLTDSFGTPDSSGSWYLSLDGNRRVSSKWTFGAHIGRRQCSGVNPVAGVRNSRLCSYTDYKLTVGYIIAKNVTLSLAETWTNANPVNYTLNGYDIGGRRLALAVTAAF